MNDKSRVRRVLFIAEAVSLAHVSRPLVLATGLDNTQWDIHFASSAAYQFHLNKHGLIHHELHSIAPETFLRRLQTGAPLYTKEELLHYISRDLAILEHTAPDVVVGDFRLSLSVSARLTGIPYITITNAHWSPYSAHSIFPLPETPLTKFFGIKATTFLFNTFRTQLFKLHIRSMNQVRARYGFRPITDLRTLYTDADWVLYADTPKLVPTIDSPPTHRYIGPIIWSPSIPTPPWWPELSSARPTIYVTLGSTGQVSLLPDTLRALTSVGATVIAATAGRLTIHENSPNAYVESYLPGQQAAEQADLVICNGGSATVYQALSMRKPVIGVCSNMDQFLTMTCIESAGAGIILRAGQATGKAIANAAQRILGDASFTNAATEIAAEFSKFNAAEEFSKIVTEVARTQAKDHG